jgi:pilus assembly protein FimV
MKRFFKISGLLAFLLLISGEVLAAGLGKLSVSSVLGQPLRAEIELLTAQTEALDSVEVKLASFDAYRQARIDRSPVLPSLHFSVEKRPDGQPVVRITSDAPVSEPFVDLLVELNWSSGRILREYTVLLDPATDLKQAIDQAALTPVAATVSSPAAQSQSASKASTPVKPAAVKGTAQGAQKTYGPVRSGETLHSIAGKVLPADVSIDMMMASLYQANQKAFAKNNMNLLKTGQILSVPDRNAVMLMFSPQQARKLIHDHAAAWHEIQNRVASQAPASVKDKASDKSAESGRIVPEQPQVKATASPAAKDVLKLSKGQPAKMTTGEDKRVHELEEEVTAKNRELQDAQGRVSELEKTVQDLQHLMDLKAKEGNHNAVSTDGQTATPAEPAKPATKPEVKAPVAVPPVQKETGFLGSLLANPLNILGALAALVLAGLLWVFMVGSRRRKGLSDFEQSIMTGGDQFKTSIFKTTSGGKTERNPNTQVGATTDFSRLGLGSIDTHDVDPIAEAEVYMAYGRDAQAEEILKEALAKEPQRHEIAAKLLEIYAARRDTASFEGQASELYAGLGDPSNSLWLKAAELGRKIDPDNPLYRLFGETSEPAVVAAAMTPVEAVEEPVSTPLEDQPATGAEEAEFEIAHPESEVAIVPDNAEEQAIDLDMDFVAESEMPAEPVTKPESTSFGLDFDPDATTALPILESEEAGKAVKEFPAFGKTVESDLDKVEEIDISTPVLDSSEEGMDHKGFEELGDLDLTSEPIEVAAPDAESLPDVQAESLPHVPHDEGMTLPDLDFSGIDLELSEPPAVMEEPAAAEPIAEIEPPSVIDPELFEEVNTKLDLAKAYLEMGDKEGAREILGEVLKEGDAGQQREAKALMDEIG